MPESAPLPWEQQPGESAKAFGAFCVYRDLGPCRTLSAAATTFYRGSSAARKRQLEKWSSAFRWVERGAAWDQHLDAEARQTQETARREMAERHAREARALQAKALERLRALRPEELTATDVLRYFVEASKLERLSRGEPETVQRQELTGQGGGPVHFSLEDAVAAARELEEAQRDAVQRGEAQRFKIEVLKCRKSFMYFCDTYCRILSDSGQGGDWVPFRLWPEQQRVARLLQENRLVVVLKARQLGLTWLVLAFALWLLLFHPIATVLLFSRRDDEAVDLLAVRLRGMHDRLPAWLKASKFTTDNDHEWALASGSRALAFPTTAGDSYTATLAIVDEADLCPDLDRLMRAVKPTIDGGGRMILLSRADKSAPESAFKRIYRGAKTGHSDWQPIFLSWQARPARDAAWYEAQQRDIRARTGASDDLYEQYPATEVEALAPRSLDKRLPADWLRQCFVEQLPVDVSAIRAAPAIPGLHVYATPEPGYRYVLGGDPAEGNPTSDDSAACVLDVKTGEQVAELAGKFEPSVFASYVYALCSWYNKAAALIERNNHGHAVLLWLRNFGPGVRRLYGHDYKAGSGAGPQTMHEGWLSSTLGKTLLYDKCADAFKNREVILHSFGTFMQLSSIDGRILRAPDGQHDDKADAFALAAVARLEAAKTGGTICSGGGPPRPPKGVFLDDYDGPRHGPLTPPGGW